MVRLPLLVVLCAGYFVVLLDVIGSAAVRVERHLGVWRTALR